MSNVVDFAPRTDAECRSWSAEPATVIILPVVRVERLAAPIQIGPTIHYDAQGNFLGVSERR